MPNGDEGKGLRASRYTRQNGDSKKAILPISGKNVGLLSLPELKGDIYGLLICESNMMLLAGISGDMKFFFTSFMSQG